MPYVVFIDLFFFCFKQKTAYEMRISDWSSDVCSSDLLLGQVAEFLERHAEALEWYRSVAGGPPREQARLRIAKVLHDLDRDDEAWAALADLQSDASIDDAARRHRSHDRRVGKEVRQYV